MNRIRITATVLQKCRNYKFVIFQEMHFKIAKS